MTYPYYGYQPQYQPVYQQNNTQQSGIVWVNGEMEARNYLLAPNAAVALWDSGAPVIYFKQSDASGRPTMRVYDLVERTQTAPQAAQAPTVQFATKEELNALAARLDALAGEGKHESDV